MAAYGHTPGHSVFRIASGNQQMLILGDLTNHPALFARNPDWSPIFDMDAQMAITTRKKIFDMAAADKIKVHGYHFPTPAIGMITKSGSGYEVNPA